MKRSLPFTFSVRDGFGTIAVALLVLALVLTRHQATPRANPAAVVGPTSSDASSAPSYSRRPAAFGTEPVPLLEDATPAIVTIHAELERMRQRETGDDATRDEILAELTPLLTDDNVASIVRTLDRNELQSEFGTAALLRWLSADSSAAAAWLAAHGGPTSDQAAIIGRTLAADSATLHTLGGVLPEGPLKETVLEHAALQLADNDPAAAMTIANRMAEGEARTNAYETIAYAWAVADPGHAGQWMTSIPDAALRQRLLATGAKAVAATDPDLAASWLAAVPSSAAAFNDTALAVADAWSARDPASAAVWADRFPATAPRNEALQLVLQRWEKSNRNAAEAWLARLPDHAAVAARLAAASTEDSLPKD